MVDVRVYTENGLVALHVDSASAWLTPDDATAIAQVLSGVATMAKSQDRPAGDQRHVGPSTVRAESPVVAPAGNARTPQAWGRTADSGAAGDTMAPARSLRPLFPLRMR